MLGKLKNMSCKIYRNFRKETTAKYYNCLFNKHTRTYILRVALSPSKWSVVGGLLQRFV